MASRMITSTTIAENVRARGDRATGILSKRVRLAIAVLSKTNRLPDNWRLQYETTSH